MAGKILTVATVLAIGCAMKLYYRHASAAELDWILAPTVRGVELVTGFRFAREAAGYFSPEAAFAVIPACAGVNFLVIAFSCLALLRLGRAIHPLLLLGGCAGVAFVATVMANTARIALAIELHRRQLSFGLLTPSRLHEAAGVAVYLSALLVLTHLKEAS